MNDVWKNKSVLVVGMARSGMAAAEMLAELGAHAVLSDANPNVGGLERLISQGCEARIGEPSESLVAGCDAVIISPAVPIDAPVVLKARSLGIPLMSELEFASRHVKGAVVAITGTNGKTTTCALTGEMFKNAGKNVYVAGNIGLPLSAVALKTKETDVSVVEVSSFQLEAIDTFHPRAAALLNLTPDHLNRHGTMEAYGALKERLSQRQGMGDFFIYNADDPFCAEVASRTRAEAVAFSSRRRLKSGAWVQDGQIMAGGRALCPVGELNLPGPHNLENALAAAAIAGVFSIPAPVIRHTLRSFHGVEHRMESVRTLGGVRYINDSKGTNPESTVRAVQSMTVPTVLIAGGDGKGATFTVLAEAIKKNQNIRHVVLIGKSAEKIAQALIFEGFGSYTMAGTDFEKAIGIARAHAQEGGAVLLSPACASFDMFKDFEDRGNQYKRIVEAL